MSVKVSVVRAGAFALVLLPLAAASGRAQAPLPGTGFVPPYEIMRTVRSAGFDPLAPPLREGTTYVLRATDFRGILMRVVVDAHSGAIRDVNRIVPGPGASGQIGMVSPSYGSPPPYGAPPAYGQPAFEAPDMAPGEEGAAPSLLRAPAARTGSHPGVLASPPLPRPRPASLASRDRMDNAKADGKFDARGNAKLGAKTDVKSNAEAPAPPVAPSNAPAVVPLNE